jgi:diamine N-acetyltransferase
VTVSGPVDIEFAPVHTAEQISTLAALAREIWYEYYVPLIGQAQVDYMVSKFQNAPAIREQIQEGYEYFLVQRAGEIMGYCGVQAQPEQGQLLLSKLYVHRDARGSGTGRRCMEFIEHFARRRGLGLLWLTVYKRNPAVKAYQRMGFRIAAPIVIDIGGGYLMDDFRMEKSLTGPLT